MLNFKNKMVVGVSITPELGLEVAQIDFATKNVIKYGCKPLPYDKNRRTLVDLDIFKETLSELLFEQGIPKGTNIVLNLPTVVFNIVDYPASLEKEQIESVIEEDLLTNPFYEDSEPALAVTLLPNSTMQTSKYAYMSAHKITLIEIVLQIRELGYNVVGIDTSVNSTLNAMVYNESLAGITPETSWVLLFVENNCCRVLMMQGTNYVEFYEEKISIGEVLGDDENYSTVVSAVMPILKNIPSQFLYVLSKTNIISAKVLADKLTYGAQIIHQDANMFAESSFLPIQEENHEGLTKFISPDVIGAAIKKDFEQISSADFSLYNKTLGDVYSMFQPPEVKIGKRIFVLNEENMIKAATFYSTVVIIIFLILFIPISGLIKQKQGILNELEQKIANINSFLKNNENISASLFDEGDEIKIGIVNNKKIYSYYTIVGTEIPQKLWLTGLRLGENIIIEGQADNLESIYSFFRNVKDYDVKSSLKLQKLGLATKNGIAKIKANEEFDTDSVLSSMNADFYEFKISDEKDEKDKKEVEKKEVANPKASKTTKKTTKPPKALPKN